MIMDAVRIVISELFLPQYVEFEAARAGAFVPIELSVSSVPGIRAGRGDRLEGILPATAE